MGIIHCPFCGNSKFLKIKQCKHIFCRVKEPHIHVKCLPMEMVNQRGGEYQYCGFKFIYLLEDILTGVINREQ